MAALEFFGQQVESAGDFHAVGVKFERVAQVHHGDLLARVQPSPQLFRRDAGDVELAEKVPPLDVLPQEVGGQRRSQQDSQAGAEAQGEGDLPPLNRSS